MLLGQDFGNANKRNISIVHHNLEPGYIALTSNGSSF